MSTTPIIDSAVTLEEALVGNTMPDAVRETLAIVSIQNLSFDGTVHQGQLVVHKDIVEDVQAVFAQLLDLKFPIQKILPIGAYEWDDNASMLDNNTAAFNYRKIHGLDEVSNHSYGRAIDINPMQNPCTHRSNGMIAPEGSVYDLQAPGTITPAIAALFIERGWEWGGNWEHTDYQHVQKLARTTTPNIPVDNKK